MSPDKTIPVPRASKQPAKNAPARAPASAVTRAQILAAAAELAKEKGAAHISVEAIAHRAGISKGGLLYHFPKKDALIRALVEQHLAEVEAVLAEAEAKAGSRPTNAVARALVEVNRSKVCGPMVKPDGILVALAEDPHLLDPMRAHEQRVAERIRNTAADRDLSLIALLAVEGIKGLSLFDANPLSRDECVAVLDRILTLLAEEAVASPVSEAVR
jgi:AcrR family transcriptional regulator